jgi:hypothetical protein
VPSLAKCATMVCHALPTNVLSLIAHGGANACHPLPIVGPWCVQKTKVAATFVFFRATNYQIMFQKITYVI